MDAELQLDFAQTGGDVKPRPAWSRALFALGLAAGGALFAYQLWESYRAVRANGAQLQQPVYLALAVGCIVVMYALQMLAWRLILANLGYALGLRATLQGFMISFMPRYVPGSVWGYLTRGEWLVRDHGIAHRVSWFGSVIEAGLLCITALGVAGVYQAGVRAGAGIGLILGATMLGAAGLAAALAMRIIGLRRAELRVAGPLWRDALRWAGVSFVYVGMWLFYGASTWCVGRGFFPAAQWLLLPFVYASAMAWLAGFLFIIVPAGLGVRESTLTVLLATSAGVPAWQGGLIAVVSRFVLIVAELIWLAVGLALHADAWRRGRNGSIRAD